MPNKSWSDYDEAGKSWVFNYIKTLPDYPGATLNNYIYTSSKTLLAAINNHPRWGIGSKERAYKIDPIEKKQEKTKINNHLLQTIFITLMMSILPSD